MQMDIDVNEYVDTFQTSLVDMTYAWCRGAKFAEVSCQTIETTHNLQKPLIEKCKSNGGFNNFCT